MAQAARAFDSREPIFRDEALPNDSNKSGVSWAAVIAGAFVAAALSLILLALGTGIGLSSVSPWANSGASGSAVGTGAIIWFIFMELVSASVGGYLAGRLRTKWSTSTRTKSTSAIRRTAFSSGPLAWSSRLPSWHLRPAR